MASHHTTSFSQLYWKLSVKSHLVTLAQTLTEAGGFRRVPLAQFSAMADVSALQDEAGVAAVMEHRPFHWRPGGLHRHPAVLQGSPHPRAQQHWEPDGEGDRDTESYKKVNSYKLGNAVAVTQMCFG